jgi:hypothetical protein
MSGWRDHDDERPEPAPLWLHDACRLVTLAEKACHGKRWDTDERREALALAADIARAMVWPGVPPKAG